MDAIKLIKDDHRTVEELFKKFQAAGKGAKKTKQRLAEQIIQELTLHAQLEEQIFYPAAQELIGDRDMVLEAEEEHHLVKTTISELRGMDASDERFEAKMTVLIENVKHHVKEEEKEMLPKVRKALKPAQLRELGERIQQAKKRAQPQKQSRRSAS